MSTKSGSAKSDRSAARSDSRRTSVASTQKSDDRRSLESRQQKTPRSPPRHNKIYRCPPTPPPEDLLFKEKSFILDCRATSSISNDYSRANPKLGPVIPPYNSQRDRHTSNYFQFHGVGRTLKRTGQNDEFATSIDGPVMDYFHNEGKGYKYLSLRNQYGCGRSREMVDGHSQFMQGIRPVIGYNGSYGFRRNTPWLRQTPSPFGVTTLSRTNDDRPKKITC